MTIFGKNGLLYLSIILVIALLAGTAAHAAAGYEAGNGALQVWNEEGQANAPKWVGIWLMILGVSFISGIFFVRRHVIARYVVLGMVANLIIGRILIPTLGIVKLSGLIGLVHVICWGPALTRRPFLEGRSLFAIWLGWITCVIIFSFIFDIRDAVIYLDHLLGIGLLS